MLSNTFGIAGDEFSLITENPEAFKSQSNTVTLRKGKRVKAKGSINGVEIPTWITLESAHWTRLTVREHYITRAGEDTRVSQVFGGVFKPVKLNVEVEINGQTMSLSQMIRNLISEQAKNKSAEEINKIIEDTNVLKGFVDGMPMMFQQMGASQNGFEHAIEIFKSAGAVDDLASLGGNTRFHTCYDFKDKPGLEVVAFELGSADRSMSKTGQGFVDVVDAVVSNMIRVIGHKKTAAILRNEIEANAASLSQSDIKTRQAKIESELQMSRQYPLIWSGAARQKDVTATGDIVTRDKYNAVNAPCGRWTVLVNDNTVDLDVWKGSTKQPSQPSVPAQIADANTQPF
jgi:hypothetical protein